MASPCEMRFAREEANFISHAAPPHISRCAIVHHFTFCRRQNISPKPHAGELISRFFVCVGRVLSDKGMPVAVDELDLDRINELIVKTMLKSLQNTDHSIGVISEFFSDDIHSDNLDIKGHCQHFRQAIPKCAPIATVVVGKIQRVADDVVNLGIVDYMGEMGGSRRLPPFSVNRAP